MMSACSLRLLLVLSVSLLLGCPWAQAVPVRTGTPLEVDVTTANTGSASVTVPSDAEFMVCGLSGFNSTASYYSGGAVTIGGSAMTLVAGDTNTAAWNGILAYKVSPATGTQTLAWDWAGTGTATEQSMFACSWYKTVNLTTPVRSTSCVQASSNPYTTATLTAQTGDLIVAVAMSNPAGITFTWVNATLVTDFGGYFNADAALAEATPTGNQTVTANTSNNLDGTVCALVLEPAAAAGGPPPRRIIAY